MAAAKCDWPMAIVLLEKGMPQARDIGTAVWWLAHCHLEFYFSKPLGQEGKHLSRAVELFQWLTGEKDPRAAEAWYWLGVCQAQKVRLGDKSYLVPARHSLGKAVELLPVNSKSFLSAKRTLLWCAFLQGQFPVKKEGSEKSQEGNSSNTGKEKGKESSTGPKEKGEKGTEKGSKGEKAKGEGKEKGNAFSPGQGNLDLLLQEGGVLEISPEEARKRIQEGARKIRAQQVGGNPG
ncbi:MAG: hypothetical protein EXR99_14990 [Gemmataceae bacterium]|nr:hypothetical protein [Gemmataceae bacterium]